MFGDHYDLIVHDQGSNIFMLSFFQGNTGRNQVDMGRKGKRKAAASDESNDSDGDNTPLIQVSQGKRSKTAKKVKKPEPPTSDPAPPIPAASKPAAKPVATPVAKPVAKPAAKPAARRAANASARPIVQRLYPCPIREQPGPNGELLHPVTGAVVTPGASTLAYLESTYFVTDGGEGNKTYLVLRMDLADIKTRVALPMMRVGRSSLDDDNATYTPTPIVRSISPEKEFEESFVQNKFSMTRHVVLVPILSGDETAEYAVDRPAFRAKMRDVAWHTNRCYWILDGATRWSLMVKHELPTWQYYVADPCINT